MWCLVLLALWYFFFKKQNKTWFRSGWLNGEEWISAWFTCHKGGMEFLPLVDFPGLYYPDGNRIPDKGNDWLLLGLEPSYLTAGPVSKCFTIQSHSRSGLCPHVCDTEIGSRVSGEHSSYCQPNLEGDALPGPGLCLSHLFLECVLTCDLWVTGVF